MSDVLWIEKSLLPESVEYKLKHLAGVKVCLVNAD